jgi:Txe/YoeB family toxin of Txe-Axe toxin-antitoxin module
MYEVILDKLAFKFIKKADKKLKETIEKIFIKMKENPYIGEELKYDKRGLYSYHFYYSNASHRMAYKVNESKLEITILLIGTRENFYRDL